VRACLVSLIISLMVGSGCAHVISERVLDEVNRNISFERLIKDPNSYQGQTVLLGGVIVKATHDPAGTLLEIYQTDIDWEKRPVDIDVSGGRFLALYQGFLDSEIYKKGRKVTLAAVVAGQRTLKLGEIDYSYPFLLIKEIHLWKKEPKPVCDPYLWYPWGMWGMWGPWGPWYYPYPYRW